MDKNQQRRFPVFGIITFLVVSTAFIFVVVLALKDVDFSSKPLSEVDVKEDIVQIKKEEFGYGVVTGSLSYPSDHIPPEMEICAEDINGELVLCTNEHVEGDSYIYGIGYTLTLPAGDYYIYAHVPSQINAEGEAYKAYYSEFVTCGLSVDCSSHEPIMIKVLQGETVSSVDPHDWYK